jgi:hypothetical protein
MSCLVNEWNSSISQMQLITSLNYIGREFKTKLASNGT